MSTSPGLPADTPAGLWEALQSRSATPGRFWREGARAYGHAASPAGQLFLRFSSDRDDVARLQHEARVRAIVGEHDVLRAPAVLDSGPGWQLERAIEGTAPRGAAAIETVVTAVSELQRLDLPTAPNAAGSEPLSHRLLRRARLVRSPLQAADLREARRIVAGSTLPSVAGHGDFHAGNVLLAGGAAWVIDWELCGPRPAGLDLMQMWPTLADAGDRALLFEGAVQLVGAGSRTELARLRFAMTVRAVAGMLTAAGSFDRDLAGAQRLLGLLPDLREAALKG